MQQHGEDVSQEIQSHDLSEWTKSSTYCETEKHEQATPPTAIFGFVFAC